MFQTILNGVVNQIVPIIVTAIVAVIAKVVYVVGDAIKSYIEEKKEAVVVSKGADKYNQNKALALDVWNFVEEHFRVKEVVGKVSEDKIALFNEMLKKYIPSLTDDEIELLRQAIAGEFNQFKSVILSDAVTPVKPIEESPAVVDESKVEPIVESEPVAQEQPQEEVKVESVVEANQEVVAEVQGQ